MDDKKIIENLSDLKSLKPDSAFLLKNRELLENQITSFNHEEKVETGIFHNFSNVYSIYFKLIPQSALVAVFSVFMVMGGGYFSLQAAQDTLPGDSLYAAKIIGEKTQLVLTFDDRNKARLGLEFAGNRAKEITRVMSDENRNDKQGEQVEKLVVDFKKEINDARTRLEKINQVKLSEAAKNPSVEQVAPKTKPKSNNDDGGFKSEDEGAESVSEAEESPHVFSANLGKDDKGLKIYEGSGALTASETEEAPIVSEKASTTPTLEKTKSNPEEMLDQAKDLLKNDDIDATLTLINEADEAIGQVGVGEVKGEVEEIDGEGSVDVERSVEVEDKKATSTD